MGGVEKPSWRAGRGREVHPEGRKGSVGLAGGLGRIWRPSRRAGRDWKVLPKGRESILEGRERSGGHPKGTGGMRRSDLRAA